MTWLYIKYIIFDITYYLNPMFKTFLLLLLSFVKPVNQKTADVAKIHTRPVLKTGWYYITDEKNNYPRQLGKSSVQYYIVPKPIVSVKHLSKIILSEDHARGRVNPYELVFRFDDAGTKAFGIATDKSMSKKIGLIIDDQLVTAPTVVAHIESGMVSLNTGEYTKAELEDFEKKIKAEM